MTYITTEKVSFSPIFGCNKKSRFVHVLLLLFCMTSHINKLHKHQTCSLIQTSADLQAFDGFHKYSGLPCARRTRNIHASGNHLRHVLCQKLINNLWLSCSTNQSIRRQCSVQNGLCLLITLTYSNKAVLTTM